LIIELKGTGALTFKQIYYGVTKAELIHTNA